MIVDRYLKDVFRFSYSILNDKERAEDMTQETFLVLWQQAGQWQPKGQLRSWLFKIARNKSIDEIRRIKPSTNIEDVDLEDLKKTPYEQTFDNEVTAITNTQMKKLPQRQREAIILVHFLGCSNIEAAGSMEITIGALESLLSRGRSKLKKLFDEDKDIYLKGELK